jgi:hypothetical protein
MSHGIVNRKSIAVSLETERKLVAQLLIVRPVESVIVGGVRLTLAAVVSTVARHLAAEEQILAVRAQLRELQTRIKPVRRRTRAVTQTVKLAAAVHFGDTSTEFQALGFVPPKQRRTTVAAKAEGVVKAKATRVARGTKGAKQKRAIRGTVPQR